MKALLPLRTTATFLIGTSSASPTLAPMTSVLWAPDPDAVARVAAAAEALLAAGLPVALAEVARRAGVSKHTIYRHEELRLVVANAQVRAGRRRSAAGPDGPLARAVAEARAALEGERAAGAEPPALSEVARRAGVSRATIYRHPHLRQLAEGGADTGAAVRLTAGNTLETSAP